jgi:RNase P/RNase MRP subunit p29
LNALRQRLAPQGQVVKIVPFDESDADVMATTWQRDIRIGDKVRFCADVDDTRCGQTGIVVGLTTVSVDIELDGGSHLIITVDASDLQHIRLSRAGQ